MRERILRQAFLHFVWATWDRLPLVTEEIERQVYRYIEQVCIDDKCDVLAVNGMPNHVHLLVRFSNTVSFAEFMQHVKGGTSRLISNELKPGEWFAWQGGYCVTSVPPNHLKTCIDYISNQKQRHSSNRLWDTLEVLPENVGLGFEEQRTNGAKAE